MRANRDKKGFATKQRMFGLLIIDEGPLLSMTDGRAVAYFKLVCYPPIDTIIVSLVKAVLEGLMKTKHLENLLVELLCL